MKKISLTLLTLMVALSLSGCGEVSSKYDGKVTAIINKETDTFEQPVEEGEIDEYYDKSNRLGFNLYLNSTDNNKIVSPITLSNTLLDLSNIFDTEFSNNIEKVIPNYEKYIDAKDLSKTQLQELYTKRVIWMDYALALKYNTKDINYNTFSDFDFYLVSNMDKNRTNTINSYITEKLGTEEFALSDVDNHDLELVGLNILDGDVILNSTQVSYKTDKFIGKNNISDKQYLEAKDILCKFYVDNNINIIEMPIESNNKSLVIDILVSNTDKYVYDILKDNSYDYLLGLINNVSNRESYSFCSLSIPIINNVYALSDRTCLKEAGLEFLFEPVKLNIGNNKIKNITLDQLNQINKISLGVSDKVSLKEKLKSNSVESISINKPFTYIIRDNTNNVIIYIGDFDN